jgi:hypothetical protein
MMYDLNKARGSVEYSSCRCLYWKAPLLHPRLRGNVGWCHLVPRRNMKNRKRKNGGNLKGRGKRKKVKIDDGN